MEVINKFPGYKFVEFGDDNKPHNYYKGEDVGFGGYVYAEPGIYYNVSVLDVQSMHPTSIILMNCFGKHTSRFKDLVDTRLAIKQRDFVTAKSMFQGKLERFLQDESRAKELSNALKISINSVYGLTSSGKYQTLFRDPRNKNNIVALRGALFMIDLKLAVQEQGFQVIHIKTDSIKVSNASEELINFIMDFGRKYGYKFEYEAIYVKMCLVNDSVYVCKVKSPDGNDYWSATGTQFLNSYVFKTLFTKEPITIDDLSEVKSTTTALYLDMNENMGEDEHNYVFIGRVGCFCPVNEGCNGGLLLREKEGKYYAVSGTKGYRWKEREVIVQNDLLNEINMDYFRKFVDDAYATIAKFGDPEMFING